MDDRNLKRLEELLNNFERMELDEYLNYVRDRRKLFRNNFLIGLARGFGNGLGLTLLSAVVIVLIQQIIKYNIPLIGDFLAEIIWIVRARM